MIKEAAFEVYKVTIKGYIPYHPSTYTDPFMVEYTGTDNKDKVEKQFRKMFPDYVITEAFYRDK